MQPEMFRTSENTVKLYAELIETKVGEILRYERLEGVVGRPLAKVRGALASARRRAQREDGAVFATIRSIGLRRLDDEGIIALAGARTNAVRRSARRTAHLIPLADFSQLREDSRRRAIAIASVLAVGLDLMKEQSLRAVGRAASGAANLQIRETLKVLGF